MTTSSSSRVIDIELIFRPGQVLEILTYLIDGMKNYHKLTMLR
jgi:hypothetical protein